MLDFLIILGVILISISILITVRNLLLLRYRMKVIRKVSKQSEIEINAGEYTKYRSRYEFIQSVSYFEMLFKFWRTFDSFFPEEYRP